MFKIKSKTKSILGFNLNKKTGHVSWVFGRRNDKIKAVGFTHNEKSKDPKVKLKHNINPKDKSPTYAKTVVEKQTASDYKKKAKFKDYRIHTEDKPTIDKIIQQNAKKK